MAKPKTPGVGGRYERDPKTGQVKKIGGGTALPTSPKAKNAAPEPAPAADKKGD